MNDVKLIRSLKRGQRGALDRAIACYSGYAAAVARSVLGNAATREDLEEIVSDVFVALWRTAERLDEDKPLKGYLAAIARNASVDRLRRQRPEDPLPEDDLLTAEKHRGRRRKRSAASRPRPCAACCSRWQRTTAPFLYGFITAARPCTKSHLSWA